MPRRLLTIGVVSIATTINVARGGGRGGGGGGVAELYYSLHSSRPRLALSITTETCP